VFLSDIVINVSGPGDINSLVKNSSLIKSLSKFSKLNKNGFQIDKNFKICNNIYSPGILSEGFNPSRKTIFSAIIDNSIKIANQITNE